MMGLGHWRMALSVTGLACLLAATGLAIAQTGGVPGKNRPAAAPALSAPPADAPPVNAPVQQRVPGKNPLASAAKGAGPHAQAAGVTVRRCINGDASIDDCGALLSGMPTSDPDRDDLIMALVLAAMDSGRPAPAFAYAGMFADPDLADEVSCEVRVAFRLDLDNALGLCSRAIAAAPAAVGLRAEIHLLAARWKDAWTDFDASYALSGDPEALFLRGLAAAGDGRMGEALKDMGQAETASPGTTDSMESRGYELLAVTSGKPLAPPEAFAAPDFLVTPALTTPAPALKSPAPAARPGGATPASTPVPMAPSSALMIRFAPDEPRGDMAPLDADQTRYCDEMLNAVIADAAGWKGTMDEKRLRLYATQRTLFAGRCAGHSEAGRRVEEARTEIAIAAAATARIQTDAKDTTPDAINCVEPMAPQDPRNPTGSAALANSCDFPVSVAYCNVSPAPGSWADMFACGRDLALAMDVIPAKGATPAVFGREVQHFACRQPAGPVLTYQPRTGLDGFCK